MPIEVHLIGEHFAAEIRGLDLREPLGVGDLEALNRAWNRHLVLVFRDQDLTPEQHIAFGANFGELWPHPVSPAVMADYPEIYVLANIVDGVPDHRPQRADFWHTDITYEEKPSRAGILYARVLPETGGDTLFANCRRAFATLPGDMQQRLLGLETAHGIEGFGERYAMITGEQFPPLPPDAPEAKPKAPVTHPAVIRHPVTGEPCLFANPGFTIRFSGMSDAASRELSRELMHHATRPDNVYRHKWRLGDMVMWDNSATMHMATGGYAPPMRRVMHRLTVGGPRLEPALV